MAMLLALLRMAHNMFLSGANLPVFYNEAMEIGDRIKAARKRAGLTQEKLAARVGVDKSAVGQWEAPGSRTGITTANLVKVADALGIGVSQLIGEGEDRLETTAPDEIALLRLFRLMDTRQKRIHLQLFYTSVGLDHPAEPEGDPSESGGMVAAGAIKQKT